MIAGNTQPDHTCISEFRRMHLDALAGLFIQVLRLCQGAGLVKLGHVAIDGTKRKANASKHKAMSYEHMKKKQDELRAKVADLLRAAERADADEDARYGKDRRGDQLPTELQRAESRRQRIGELMTALEAEAREQQAVAATKAAKDDSDDDDAPPPSATALPSHQVRTTADGKPTPKRSGTSPPAIAAS